MLFEKVLAVVSVDLLVNSVPKFLLLRRVKFLGSLLILGVRFVLGSCALHLSSPFGASPQCTFCRRARAYSMRSAALKRKTAGSFRFSGQFYPAQSGTELEFRQCSS